jgi:nitrous oxidase accessory protein
MQVCAAARFKSLTCNYISALSNNAMTLTITKEQNFENLNVWVPPYQRTLLFAIFIMVQCSLRADTITVCPSCKVKTISQGIALAADYDTILIHKGTYKEVNIKITKPLTLAGMDYPVIDGEDKGEVITILSDHVTISGLNIINVGTSYTADYAAIRVVQSENFLIENVILEKLFFGIYL